MEMGFDAWNGEPSDFRVELVELLVTDRDPPASASTL
jgi:hypothetical protein